MTHIQKTDVVLVAFKLIQVGLEYVLVPDTKIKTKVVGSATTKLVGHKHLSQIYISGSRLPQDLIDAASRSDFATFADIAQSLGHRDVGDFYKTTCEQLHKIDIARVNFENDHGFFDKIF